MFTPRPRDWFALLAVIATTAGPAACSTKAVGIEECRRIEYARCEAAPNCPEFGVKDVESCRLFYRDHCLHGLQMSSPPATGDVNACVEAVRLLASCAAGLGPDAPPSSCGDAYVSVAGKVPTVCKLLAQPEAIPDCDFVVGALAAGGQTGVGGAAAASNNQGGASGTSSDPNAQGGLFDFLGIGGLPF